MPVDTFGQDGITRDAHEERRVAEIDVAQCCVFEPSGDLNEDKSQDEEDEVAFHRVVR